MPSQQQKPDSLDRLRLRADDAVRWLEGFVESSVGALKDLANWMGRLAGSFFRLITRGGWQVLRFAGVVLFFLYVASTGIELILAANRVSLIFAAWSLRCVGALIGAAGIILFLAPVLVLISTRKSDRINDGDPSAGEPAKEAKSSGQGRKIFSGEETLQRRSAMPGILLCLDLGIWIAIYFLGVNSIRLQTILLAATQRLVELAASFISRVF